MALAVASPNTKIWMALKRHIQQVAGTLPVVFPASPEIRKDRHLRAALSGAVSDRLQIKSGQARIRTGSLTLISAAPVGQVVEVYIQWAEELASAFPEGACFHFADVHVTLTGAPEIQTGYRAEDLWHVPIFIPWRTIA